MARRFNREANLRILQNMEKEQREQKERVDKLTDKFKSKEAKRKNKFISDCKNEYEFCKSRLKRK